MRHEPIVSPAALDYGVQSHEWMVDTARLALRKTLVDRQFGRAAVVSSFGAESAVLLHLVAAIGPDTPVLFVDTQMMFQETLDYQLELSAKLGLTDVRRISQKTEMLRREDVFGRLHLKDTDACCHLRKKLPLDEALAQFDCWINGRKRHQSTTRHALRPFETDEAGRLKVNPLAYWERDDIERYMEAHDLPRHPLVAEGFTSIGCAPCTRLPVDANDTRSGRWAGAEKTECGIHISGGVVTRKAG